MVVKKRDNKIVENEYVTEKINIEEYKRVVSGEKPQYQVFEEMLMTH